MWYDRSEVLEMGIELWCVCFVVLISFVDVWHLDVWGFSFEVSQLMFRI